MAKILYCASSVGHIKNFHIPYIEALSNAGNVVDVMCDKKVEKACVNKTYCIDFKNSRETPKIMSEILNIRKILFCEHYDFLVVNTTLAAGMVRLAALLLPRFKISIFYICHGYLFTMNSGFSKLFQIICEKILSLVTTAIFVMNREDFGLALKYKFAKKIYFTNGMGLNKTKYRKFTENEIENFKKQRGLKDKKIVLCIGELSKRKNQKEIIMQMPKVIDAISDVLLIFAGDGKEKEKYQAMVSDNCLDEKVVFLGHIENVDLFLQMADVVVASSLCEGLPFCIMEAMLYHKKIVASDIKGHRDLLDGQLGAVLYKNEIEDDLSEKLISVLTEVKNNKTNLSEKYILENCMSNCFDYFKQ